MRRRRWDAWRPCPGRCRCEACRQLRHDITASDGVTAYDSRHPAFIFKELEARKRNVDEAMAGIRQVVQGKLSIASRVQYLNRALIEGQDWIEWCRGGIVQTLSPMNYGTDIEVLRRRIRENRRRLGDAPVEVLEGLAKKSSAGANSTQALVEQVRMVVQEGADGAVIFPFHALEEEDLLALARVKRQLS